MQKKHILISNLVIWIDRVNIQNKRQCLNVLKLKLAGSKIKNLKKNNFQSVLAATNSHSNGQSNSLVYMSINDFKPIKDNYSSINVSNENSSLSGFSSIKGNYQSLLKSEQTFCKIDRNIIKNIIEDNTNKDTFLQNWMIRETNCNALLFEEYPKSNYCFKKIRSYHQQALDSIKKYSFESYCKQNIKAEGFWVFKSYDRLKHSKQLLSDSMTYLNQVQTEKALQIFQNILKAAGEMETQKIPIYHVYRALQVLHQQNDDLIQQTFLQLAKQLQSKKLIYMKILCAFSAMIKPSSRIYLPLLNYLNQSNIMAEENGITEEHYNYCFFHLIKNFDQPKLYLPSLFEINSFMNMKKIPITISFPKQKQFFIQSFTTVKQFIQEIIQFYDLDPKIQYLLLINGCFLQSGFLLDKLNKYENKTKDKKIQEYNRFATYRAAIVLKNMNDFKKSKRCFNIMYNYYVNQYLKGLFPLNQAKVLDVAALIMHSEMEDQQVYYFDFKKIVSARIRKKMETAEEKKKYKNHILNRYFNFNGTKIQARKKIISIISDSKGYMTHFFKCSVFLEDLEEIDNWVGVKCDRFIFIEPQTGRYIREIKYTEISEWGATKSQICIKVAKLGKLHIDTLQAEVLASIFENYLNYIYTEYSCITPKVIAKQS